MIPRRASRDKSHAARDHQRAGRAVVHEERAHGAARRQTAARLAPRERRDAAVAHDEVEAVALSALAAHLDRVEALGRAAPGGERLLHDDRLADARRAREEQVAHH